VLGLIFETLDGSASYIRADSRREVRARELSLRSEWIANTLPTISKGIKELALSAFPPTHLEPLPPMPLSINGIIVLSNTMLFDSKHCPNIRTP
jgi:hypothetical protein